MIFWHLWYLQSCESFVRAAGMSTIVRGGAMLSAIHSNKVSISWSSAKMVSNDKLL
jgi:hypothetical protein